MTPGDAFGFLPKLGSASERLPVCVVTDHPIASRWLLSLFSDPFFQVTLATSFADAKQLLREWQPSLIVAAVQLGEFNGLGLVLRAKATNPEVRAVVLSRVADTVLQADAEALGATFVSLPIEHRELRAAIIRTIFQPAVTPIRAPFERRRTALATPPSHVPTAAAVERERREALFPIPLPAMVGFDTPRADA